MKFSSTFNFYKDRLPAVKGIINHTTDIVPTEVVAATAYNCVAGPTSITPTATIPSQALYPFLNQYVYATESTKLYLPTSGAFRYGTFEYDILSNIERVTILLLPSSVSFLDTTTLLGPSTQFIICDVWLQGPDNGHIDIYYVNMPHADVSVSFPSIHSSNETFAIGVKNDQTLDPNDFFIEITRQSDSSSITIPQPVNTVDSVKVVYCFNTLSDVGNPAIDSTYLFSSAVDGFETQINVLDIPAEVQNNQRWKYQGPTLTYNGKEVRNNDLLEFDAGLTELYLTRDIDSAGGSGGSGGSGTTISSMTYDFNTGIFSLVADSTRTVTIPSVLSFDFNNTTSEYTISMNDNSTFVASLPISLTNCTYVNLEPGVLRFAVSDGTDFDIELPVTNVVGGAGINVDELQSGVYTFTIADDADLPGDPTTSTPLLTDNSTRIANTEFVQSKISELVGSAPEVLDTLQEIAAALNDDPNVINYIMAEISDQVKLDSIQSLTPLQLSNLTQTLQIGRKTTNITTGTLSPSANVTGTVNLGKSYKLLKITTSSPCRVRLYVTAAKRDDDVSRNIGVDPSGNHGLMFEAVTFSGSLEFFLSPIVDGWDGELVPTGSIAYTVTNTDLISQALTITFTYVTTEY